MSNPADGRKDRRFSISEFLEYEFKNVYIEIMLDEPVRASLTDISMNGLGFIITDNSNEAGSKIDKTEKLFINIHLGSDVILIDTKKTWGTLVKGKGGNVYQGGAMFTMISPKDRLTLFNFLEKTRKRA
ncbi:MAG: PilZ domain-containing protein [Spirochaetes bacterium]|jgi:c-di-GMP-binding flagellar brake protein YcgR|nr:PilZ domain-containing protein [Spirochaetota bacterium]